MVDRFEVFREADKLRALRGKQAVRVSVRRVRDKLLRRGSFSDVAPVLSEWKASRNYQPVIELMELPDVLQRRLGEFGKALLDEVQAHESRIRDVERTNLEIERTAYREALDEAGMTVDVLEARVAALTAEVERLRASGALEPATVQPQRSPMWEKGAALREAMSRRIDGQVPVGAQDAFWQAVEREILGIIGRQGPMYAGDLLFRLPLWLKEQGSLVEMPLSAGWLRFRLRTMVASGGSLLEREGKFALIEEGATDGRPTGPATANGADHGR